MELQQLCLDHIHQHDLIFVDQQVYKYGKEILCFMCLEPLMDGGYNCTSDCYFFVHKACAELPIEIHHPSHRKHPLILLPNHPPYGSRRSGCNFCELIIYGFLYNCTDCSMDLHIKCAMLARCFFDPDNHKHRLVIWSRYNQFTCDFCATYTDYCSGRFGVGDTPWICTECHVIIHKNCKSLPRIINIRHHHHPLIHTYFIADTESVDLICGICCGEVKREYGCYCCQNCAYFVHVTCAKANKIDEATKQAWRDMGNEIEIGEEEELPEEIEHFSHPHHKLALVHHHDHDHLEIDRENNNWKCDGCMSLILSAPFYKCVECDFFLHVNCCTKLPKQINHPLHPQHSLILSTIKEFSCVACAYGAKGFAYSCHTCLYIQMDVRCALVNPYEFIHDSHEHPLCVTTKEDIDRFNWNHCSCCGEDGMFMLRCKKYCAFALDYRCATLPLRVNSKYDKHGLVLTYHGDEESDYFHYCDICEKHRDTKVWFYCCPNSAECPWYAHLECALAEYPYLQHGISENLRHRYLVWANQRLILLDLTKG